MESFCQLHYGWLFFADLSRHPFRKWKDLSIVHAFVYLTPCWSVRLVDCRVNSLTDVWWTSVKWNSSIIRVISASQIITNSPSNNAPIANKAFCAVFGLFHFICVPERILSDNPSRKKTFKNLKSKSCHCHKVNSQCIEINRVGGTTIGNIEQYYVLLFFLLFGCCNIDYLYQIAYIRPLPNSLHVLLSSDVMKQSYGGESHRCLFPLLDQSSWVVECFLRIMVPAL